MKVDSIHTITEDWNNVYYDRTDESIDFHNETDSLYVHGISPATVIRMFRNATCAGCNCTKLQDMDLPEHARENLREITDVLNAWKEKEERETAYEEDMEDMNRQGAETMAAALL